MAMSPVLLPYAICSPRRCQRDRMLLAPGTLALTTCSRVAPADVSDEVERICAAFCEQNVACHEPELFETVSDNNVIADDYTCKAEKELRTHVCSE